MRRYWSSIVAPVLTVARPRSIVEIGAGHGDNTKRLLALSAPWNGTVHAIDPLPRFPADDWEREYGERFRFHRDLSRHALPGIARADAYLIDGDHNWYTVRQEFDLIERAALAEAEQPFPLVFLHASGWPYARRDRYFDPRSLPGACVQRFRKGGVVPGRAELSDNEGLAAEHNHSISEGGPRTGVLTALEDFISESKFQLAVFHTAAFHGLAVVTDAAALASSTPVARLLGELRWTPLAAALIEQLERARVEAAIAAAGERAKRVEHAVELAKLREFAALGASNRELERKLAEQSVLAAWKARAEARILAHPLGRLAPGFARRILNARDRRDIQGSVDANWYRRTYPDVAATALDPADHYVQCGVFEGRNPGPGFSTVDYLLSHPDVVAAGINPLLHYARFGAAERRKPVPAKDAARAPRRRKTR
jgi:hypothetical protein